MSTQLFTRFDIVTSNRLRYLSHFSSATAETKVWGPAFASYCEASLPTPMNGICKIPIEYELSSDGRYRASTRNYNGLSIQRMEKKVRSFLVPVNTQDIDVENAAPTVLNQLFKKAGCDTGYLTFFVDNYDDAMTDLRLAGFNDDKTKMVKNWMLFGAGEGADGLPQWVHRIRRELEYGRPAMYEKYPDLYQEASIVDNEKREKFEKESRKRDHVGTRRAYTSNLFGIFLAKLYHQHEGKILLALDQAGRDMGIWDQEIAWIFDGIMVFPSQPLRDDHLATIQGIIHDKTSLDVKLKLKPLGESLNLDITKFPKPVTLYECTHEKAARIVQMAIEGTYVRDRRSEYVLRDGMWSRSDDAVKLHLQRVAIDLDIRKIVINPKTEEEKIVPFTGSNSDLLKTISSLRPLIQDATTDDFAHDVVLGGIGKLAFKDGYYQFSSVKTGDRYGHFIKGGSFNTFCVVGSCFPQRDEDAIEFVFKEIINPMFDNTETGLKELFLTALARALAGCTDKITYILHGPRNSGKSVLFQLLDNALGMYVRTIPSATFTVGDGYGSGDSFRQNGFMIDAELARIIKMSELPPSTSRHHKVKIDGSKIKVFQSMKEGVVARALYMHQRPYYSVGTGFFLMNDVPEFSPSDSMDRCHLFELPNEFVSAKEKDEDRFNASKKIANPDIEQWIRMPKYTDAIIHILLDAYRPDPIVPLPSMIECKEDVMTGQGDDQYLSCIEVTMEARDKVSFPDLKIALDKFGIQDNVVAMGRALKRIIINAFKLADRTVPEISDIKRQNRQRKHPEYLRTFYHYIRLRTISDRIDYSRNRDFVGGASGISDEEYARNGGGSSYAQARQM